MPDSPIALAVALVSAACAMNLFLSVALFRRVRSHDRALGRLLPLMPLESRRPAGEAQVEGGEAELAALFDTRAR